jgi:hypothetical protein
VSPSEPDLDEMVRVEFQVPVGTPGCMHDGRKEHDACKHLLRHAANAAEQDHALSRPLRHAEGDQQLGLLSRDPISVSGVEVRPRDLLHALWEPQIRAEPDLPDLALIRILAKGIKDGVAAEVQVDLRLAYDEKTGFRAMEQGTGWHASIFTAAIASGLIPHGVIPVERAMSGEDFVHQAERRGFEVRRMELGD